MVAIFISKDIWGFLFFVSWIKITFLEIRLFETKSFSTYQLVSTLTSQTRPKTSKPTLNVEPTGWSPLVGDVGTCLATFRCQAGVLKHLRHRSLHSITAIKNIIHIIRYECKWQYSILTGTWQSSHLKWQPFQTCSGPHYSAKFSHFGFFA